jgi:hypothetical protein
MILVKIYLAGVAVLIAAILLNLLSGWLGLATWYSFLSQASEKGLGPALQSLTPVDYLFLIVVYPGLLGLAAYLTMRLLTFSAP